jgi:hypothetical protein
MNWKYFAIHVAVCIAIGAVIAYFSSARWLAAAFWVSASLNINGSIAVYEDAQPGGFDNPDGSERPAEIMGESSLRHWARSITIALALAAAGLAIQFYG